jgi:hypothetical protein
MLKYNIDNSLFWTNSANAILWCLFWSVSLGNSVILYGYEFKSLLSIRCTDRLDIPSCAAAFLVDLLGLLCSVTLTASVFSGERTEEGRRRFYSNTEWVIKFINCFEWRRPSHLKTGTKPPLCDNNTSCFSKEQHCFYALFYRQSSFVSHLV